ncbi:hypothetical protein Q8G41_27590, partial [Klebsiella pneumoniae]|uniref:hypothetical protein n=1 Tax=Klebsiella pneumoniae TaxID=573 RepID=UPI003013CF04
NFFRIHPASPADPVQAAWGSTTQSKPAFIGLASPLVVISTGRPALPVDRRRQSTLLATQPRAAACRRTRTRPEEPECQREDL